MNQRLATALAAVLLVGAAAGCDIIPGANRFPAPSGEPALVLGGEEFEPGIVYRHFLYAHCGVEWLGEFNGRLWRTDPPRGSGIDFVPDNWVVGAGQEIDVLLVYEPAPDPRILASAADTIIVYRPAQGPHPGCD